MKILVVDDQASVLLCLAESFKKLGHTVSEACNGEQAMALLEKNGGIELVITDLSMPGMSGIELTKKVKQTAPSVRVCIMSGHFYGNSREEALGAGAEKALEKPITALDLSQKLAI